MTTTRADPGCPDCGWRPAEGEKWPSEGRAAVRWMESLLICAEGDWFGKPLRLRPDQKRFVWRWYEFCPVCGYWHYDQALRGAATGDGKTTFVAALECLEMFGPPQIAPVSPNIINAAASFEQADLLFSIAGVMLGGRDQAVKEAPLCGYAEVYDTEIRYADGRPGIMKRVAAVAGTNEGGLPSLFVCDEVHEWGDVGSTKARVHMVIGKSTKKRRMICRMPDGREVARGPGRNLNISTAGFDVEHSLLGAMYLHGKKAEHDPGLAPRLRRALRPAATATSRLTTNSTPCATTGRARLTNRRQELTREEMINLTEFMAVICPQQKIGRASAVAWYEVIGHLDFQTARNAVISVKHSQAFVDPSDIIREAERANTRTIGDDPAKHPSARTAAEAIAASSLRELPAAQAVPPTPEYLAARADMDAKLRQRAEQVMLTDREAERRANAWLDYKLSGKLPPQLPLSGPPAPRWVPLPGDQPELRAWLARQPAETGSPP